MMIFNYLYIRSIGVFVMDVPRKYHYLIVFRAFVGFGGLTGSWGACKYMPVGIANCIFSTWVIYLAVMARIFLNEKLKFYDVIALVTSMIGVFLINNPF